MKYKNNPANIRSGSLWLGLSGNRKGFCEFETLECGVRALLYILHKYYYVYHLVSVTDILNRFAPPSENDTKSYISYCEARINFSVPNLFIPQLARCICKYESGSEIDIDFIIKVYNKIRLRSIFT